MQVPVVGSGLFFEFDVGVKTGMTKYRVDRILPAYRPRNGSALLCATRLIIDK